ncbi:MULTISPECIES: hypothetical protein [unclassified Pseudoclavibacter]|uniref:hypothetical protein n=1 Tax=unclassified Pseudoclavibacter TaxID=2615177 RepID=UPI001300CD62|nr:MULTISPECIES: hypothetical protein [unclassified Pseudoclavibacter]KAB1644435.1 hypothetical protein F8O06_10370 [Pseudoclavibacter sp. CFCC 14310]KAB1659062.1 hypothetical protein F8O09_05750 [Pseudoclavibacter sp. CFCC 11306]KAB1660959.1 hypothetical protein F8O07_03040 [Pseudoclavibacter sp. CFCC 13796]KAB1664062.1 hypothetical protein F8O08_01150 [Pseudoclavibacter sp. CFCC 13611]
MSIVTSILVFLHILGAAALVGGWLATFKTPTVTQWQLIGALVQLVSGIALVGLAEMDGHTINYIKIGVKLVLAIVIAAAAFVGRGKAVRGETVPVGLAHAVGGLALVNVAVATLWH